MNSGHAYLPLVIALSEAGAANETTAGARRRHFRAAGRRVNRKRVARGMRVFGIAGVRLRRKVRTTVSEPSHQKVPDLLQRDFTASTPGLRYVGDITYPPLADGSFLYLATVLDLGSRRTAGWSIADHMRTGLVADALRAAEVVRGSLAGAIFHADHGAQGGLEQEMWALLTLYQLPRTVMVDAAESLPGTDPDRCSFTIAPQSARDQVIQAAGVACDDSAPGAGVIARAVLTALLPARRLRVSTRKVKSPVSRYKERLDDGRPGHSRAVTGLVITLLHPLPTPLAVSRDERSIAPAERRRQQQVLALLHQDPSRSWPTQDIARHLGDVTLNTMYRQLSRWAGRRLIRKIGPGVYTAWPISSALLPAAQKP